MKCDHFCHPLNLIFQAKEHVTRTFFLNRNVIVNNVISSFPCMEQ